MEKVLTMIEFEYKLPRYYVGQERIGQYNNPEMVLPCVLTTKDCRLGNFLHALHKGFSLAQAQLTALFS